MNIITRASVKERIHVEQIIRSQPHMHNSGLVDIVTIPVRKCLGLSMDAHKRDTNQLAWQLKLKGTRCSVHSANNLFAKESFAARHPETRYAQAANTAMLAFFENK